MVLSMWLGILRWYRVQGVQCFGVFGFLWGFEVLSFTVLRLRVQDFRGFL